jgi:hypothetical protein
VTVEATRVRMSAESRSDGNCSTSLSDSSEASQTAAHGIAEHKRKLWRQAAATAAAGLDVDLLNLPAEHRAKQQIDSQKWELFAAFRARREHAAAAAQRRLAAGNATDPDYTAETLEGELFALIRHHRNFP